MSETKTALLSKAEGILKDDEFQDFFANNTLLHSSLWDLRILFGQVDQTLEGGAAVYKASVSIPWPQVKVFVYFLRLHLSGYEARNGRIRIPPGIIPEWPSEPQHGEPNDEWKVLRQVWESFIAENPEAK